MPRGSLPGGQRRDDPAGAAAPGRALATGEAVDHQPRPGVRAEKRGARPPDPLAATHPTWALGFQDEVWWSRLAFPPRTWIGEEDGRLRLVEQAVAQDDPDPKALACYGLLVRADPTDDAATDEVWLRFAEDRPVSPVTIDYLDWCCRKLQANGKAALLLVWDNAPWHVSHEVRTWIRDHNRRGQAGAPVSASSPATCPAEPLAQRHRGQMGPRQTACQRSRSPLDDQRAR